MIVHWDMHYPDAPRTDGGPSTTAGRKTVSCDVFAQLVGEHPYRAGRGHILGATDAHPLTFQSDSSDESRGRRSYRRLSTPPPSIQAAFPPAANEVMVGRHLHHPFTVETRHAADAMMAGLRPSFFYAWTFAPW